MLNKNVQNKLLRKICGRRHRFEKQERIRKSGRKRVKIDKNEYLDFRGLHKIIF